jgi:hypothetical protein
VHFKLSHYAGGVKSDRRLPFHAGFTDIARHAIGYQHAIPTGFIDVNQHAIGYQHAIPTGFTDVNQHAICYQHCPL